MLVIKYTFSFIQYCDDRSVVQGTLTVQYNDDRSVVQTGDLYINIYSIFLKKLLPKLLEKRSHGTERRRHVLQGCIKFPIT